MSIKCLGAYVPPAMVSRGVRLVEIGKSDMPRNGKWGLNCQRHIHIISLMPFVFCFA
jgi:hypothetical protein